MNDRNDSKLYTVAFAVAVALVCSMLVSAAAYYLRPIARAYDTIELNRAVLEAAGRMTSEIGANDRAAVEAFLELESHVVDLTTDEFAPGIDPATIDFRAAADDRDTLQSIPAELDVAGLAQRPRFAPVYLSMDGQDIDRIVLPFYARGMWSTIHGVIALESDFSTIAGVVFYAHGETPGIGDRIDGEAWRAEWIGKRLYDDAGEQKFGIGAATAERPARFTVDSITGATVTASAVGDSVSYWFSEDGYGPFLRRLRLEGR